ncbi:galactose-1-phosphate uridylyltransferase [Amycolatopsis coloradensis]|uniref:Galactose-1-phosphate uridylyltransferase n=1 Tax=Amycolatopsis coloradensis TaxID=76021 RepID=A0ACD5BFY9_9PSEU
MTTTRQWHGGELRQQRLTGDWTILAPGRAARPHGETGGCPFCPGPGEDTPPESWRLPAVDGVGWRVRAVPNRYALSDRHEVIIESPRHDWDPVTGSDAELTDVLFTWQQRHIALRGYAAQVVIFRNHGRAAGTSLSHPHSQLAGLPVLAPGTLRRLEAFREHHRRFGRPFASDELAEEFAVAERIVHSAENTVVFAPFAPTAAYELRLVPRRARADFAMVPRPELREIAHTLRLVLGALGEEIADLAYNIVVDTAPTGWEQAPFLTWSIHILPRRTVPAGLESATGIPVVTTTPERAAACLKARLTKATGAG